MSIAGMLRRWVLVSAVTGVLALIQVPGVRAQAVSPSPAVSPADIGSTQPVQMPPNPNPNQPVQMPPSPGPLNSPANGDAGAPGWRPGWCPVWRPGWRRVWRRVRRRDGAGMAPGMAPGMVPAAPAGYSSGLSTLDVIYESLFGDIYTKESMASWTPLTLDTFFSEGWDQAYLFPPSGSGGAPRHGWLQGLSGTFFRAWFFAFITAQDFHHNGNLYVGQYTIFAPLNRRFEFQFDYHFIVSNKGGTSNTYHGNTGDTTIYGRFQLSETKNFSQLFQLGFNVPTGRESNGNGVAFIQPQYQFWYNIYGNWSMRGFTGVTVPTNHAKTSGYTSYNNNLAIGRYFKGKDDGWIQQFWVYMAAIENSTIAGPKPRGNYFSLQPGIRFRIPVLKNLGTGYWYGFAAVEVPMIGPQKQEAFTFQPALRHIV